MVQALLVIDMLNDFLAINPKRVSKIIPKIKELLDFARRQGLPIVYINDAHLPFDTELRLRGSHAIKGRWGSQVIEELKPQSTEYVIEKRRYSGFFATGLDALLRDIGVNTLILVGVSADACILCTALDAFYRGYLVIVVEDCIESFTEEGHKSALHFMRTLCGCKIEKVADLIRHLRNNFL